MKKIYTGVICFIWTAFCYSQVILIDQVIFEPGDNITVVFDNGYTDEGNEGQNMMWDYSNASGTDTITWRGVDPIDYDIAQNYWPDSDLGALIPAPTNDTIDFKTYEFYDFDLNRISTIGSYSIIKNKITNVADTQIVNYILNPFEEFEFPLAYSDEFESDYSGTISGSFQGIETNGKRGGTVVMSADATGTIHTPTGTYNNVLRVKRIETRFDTTIVEFEGQTFETVLKTENTIYDWLQPERKFTLYRIIYSKITYPGLPPQDNEPAAFYTIENGVSAVNNYTDLLQIKLFPNPTQDIIFIENFADGNVKSVQIYNMHGSKEMEIINPSNQISLATLSSGNYVIKIATDLGVYTQKIVKM